MESDESQSGRILVYFIWFYFYSIILIGLELDWSAFFFAPLLLNCWIWIWLLFGPRWRSLYLLCMAALQATCPISLLLK